MKNSVLQMDGSAIDESFESTNNLFDEFRIFPAIYFSKLWIGSHQF